MFQAGDLLVYGSTGVCRVLSIDRRQERVGSIRQERLYYQLKPIYQGGLIYTPVDNDKVSMRPIISRQEAEDLISEIPTLHPAACRASTTQALTQQYQASLRQHDCRRQGMDEGFLYGPRLHQFITVDRCLCWYFLHAGTPTATRTGKR